MNILLVAPQPFFRERGTPIAVRLLVQTLCEAGHQVDLLVYHEGDDIRIPGMRLIRAGRPPGIHQVPIGISTAKIICDVWLIARMIPLLVTRKYDVVHAVEEAIFPAVLFNLGSKRKLVYDMDSSLSEQLTDKWQSLKLMQRFWRWMERSAVTRSNAVLAVCEDLAIKVRPWAGAERVTVLPDVPLDPVGKVEGVEQLRASLPAAALLALYVGNLERYQGIDLMLEGFAQARAENVVLIVIGGNPQDVAAYTAKAASFGLGNNVRFLGPRPLDHLGAYLAQADILVSPRTMGQNTPMKVYSYMQSGRAMLATDIRSHTQVLDPSCAQLVKPNAVDFASGLQRLSQDPALRARLAAAASHKVATEYSLQVFRDRLLGAYARL